MTRLDDVIPWSVARFLLVIALVVAIAAAVALFAHSVPFPHSCPRVCREKVAWTRLPAIEIFGMALGVGLGVCGVIGAIAFVQRQRRLDTTARQDAERC